MSNTRLLALIALCLFGASVAAEFNKFKHNDTETTSEWRIRIAKWHRLCTAYEAVYDIEKARVHIKARKYQDSFFEGDVSDVKQIKITNLVEKEWNALAEKSKKAPCNTLIRYTAAHWSHLLEDSRP